MFFSPTLGLAAGLVCLFRGFRAARYYLFAWGTLCTATIVLAFYYAGILPDWPFLSNSLLIGSTVEATLLSLAMADRIRIIKEQKEKLEQNEENLRRLSQTDPLTGLFNKRVFNSALSACLSQALNSARPMSLLMIDIDDFKKINDTCGHLQGDRVLIELANVLKDNVRTEDICCRYGGEEFVIILPYADTSRALQVAERLRSCFEALRFEPSNQVDRATVSIGLAEYISEDTEKSIIFRADQALYQAKRSGKNQVSIGR
jgi:diguanylate cyclase (GGDEF)-like protein